MRTRNYLREFKWSNFYCLRFFSLGFSNFFFIVVWLFVVRCGFFPVQNMHNDAHAHTDTHERKKTASSEWWPALIFLFFSLFQALCFWPPAFILSLLFLIFQFWIVIFIRVSLFLPQSMHFFAFSLSLSSFFLLSSSLLLFVRIFFFKNNFIFHLIHANTHILACTLESVVNVVRG